MSFCECGCGKETNGRRLLNGHLKFLVEKLKLVKKLCACGCGNEVKPNLKKGIVPDFIHGHNKPMLNKHHSEETKNKISRREKELFNR